MQICTVHVTGYSVLDNFVVTFRSGIHFYLDLDSDSDLKDFDLASRVVDSDMSESFLKSIF